MSDDRCRYLQLKYMCVQYVNVNFCVCMFVCPCMRFFVRDLVSCLPVYVAVYGCMFVYVFLCVCLSIIALNFLVRRLNGSLTLDEEMITASG